MHSSPTALKMLAFPYTHLPTVGGAWKKMRPLLKAPGTGLVWDLGGEPKEEDYRVVNSRPGGAALILILPRSSRIQPTRSILQLIQTTRPNAILPSHQVPHVDHLTQVLRRPPTDLPSALTEYLGWRGFSISRGARQLIRQTAEFSTEITSIGALAKRMYLSRRALGRRFEAELLPAPSHWLHLCRLLRVAFRLQNSDDSVLAVAFQCGYTDGFSLSNQMRRMTGVRPSEARKYLGWEWILEGWLCREAEHGRLRPQGASGALLAQTGAQLQCPGASKTGSKTELAEGCSPPDHSVLPGPAILDRRRGNTAKR
jgi:AraC-like DNA-binding protein